MKIIGGRGIGADKEKMRIVEIEPGDVVGKQFQVHSEGNDLWVTYYEDGPSGRMSIILDDPVETAEPPAPFWVKPQAAEKAQGWVASREAILQALEGQIVDADANAGRYPVGSQHRAELLVTCDTLKGVKRMMERRPKVPEKTLEERVADLERQVAFLLARWQGVPGHPLIQRRLPDAIGKPASEPWIPTVEAKP